MGTNREIFPGLATGEQPVVEKRLVGPVVADTEYVGTRRRPQTAPGAILCRMRPELAGPGAASSTPSQKIRGGPWMVRSCSS
jgi:hypothetical protein